MKGNINMSWDLPGHDMGEKYYIKYHVKLTAWYQDVGWVSKSWEKGHECKTLGATALFDFRIQTS